MMRSTDRIITTHAGSLPRPEGLRQAWANPETSEKELNALLRSSVADVVRSQLETGVDVLNDGEFGKPMRSASDLAAWGVYIFDRLSGFGTAPR
jgi:5-methyltetrahydropteroyltriglutamate--homocysteine methyltransferase